MKKNKKNMEEKHRRLADYCFQGMKTVEAGRKAGYTGTDKTVKERVARIRACSQVFKDETERLQDQLRASTVSMREEIIQVLHGQMTASIESFIDVDGNTGEPAFNLKKAKAAKQLGLIEEISFGMVKDEGKYLKTVKLYSKQAAAVALAKIIGLEQPDDSERIQSSQPWGINITVEQPKGAKCKVGVQPSTSPPSSSD